MVWLPRLVQLAFVLLCGIVWHVVTVRGLVNPLLLPPFAQTMAEFWDLLRSGDALPDLAVTLYELAVAFALAAALGVSAGYLVSRTRFRVAVFDPLFSALYAVPSILLFPLYVLFFGLGPGSKIALGATIAFFPVVLTTIAGFGTVEAGLVRAARSMGADGWRLFWLVMLPGSLPVILGGLRLALVAGLLSILGGETIASLSGLGHQIVAYSDAMDTARMLAYTLLALAVAVALNAVVTSVETVAVERIR